MNNEQRAWSSWAQGSSDARQLGVLSPPQSRISLVLAYPLPRMGLNKNPSRIATPTKQF
jgi:hypothetical protein